MHENERLPGTCCDMTETFEIYVLPIIRKDGSEQNQITGLFASSAPRHCQRARKQDRLLIWMTMVIGHTMVSEERMQELTKEAARLYFNTRGTVTSGLQTAANHINTALRVIAGGEHVGAKVNMCVFHGDTLYMAHAGAVYTFLLRDDEVTAFFNSLSHSQLPGYVAEVQPEFFQTRIEAGDALLLTPQPAQQWEREVLQFGSALSLPNIRRRLLDQTYGDFTAMILQLQPGENGAFHRMRPAIPQASPQPTSEAKREEPAPPTPAKEEQAPAVEPRGHLPEPAVYIGSEPSSYEEDEPQPTFPDETETQAPLFDDEQEDEHIPPEAPREEQPPLIDRLPLPDFARLRQQFAQFWFRLRKLDQKESPPPRVISDDDEEPEDEKDGSLKAVTPGKDAKEPSPLHNFRLPFSNSLLLGIAILLPLIISVIAATVYSQRGVQQQFEYYYGLADQIMDEALQEPQAIVRQSQLETALDYLNQAETFNQNSESKALRDEILALLSDRENILRVELFPAAQVRLNRNVNLTRMVTTKNNDLYALDANSGRVLYFRFMGNYYEYDDTFQCGDSGLQRVVDMAPLSPFNTMNAAIVAITEGGALRYCQPGQPPTAALINVPAFGWSNIQSISVERDYLFVLDIGTRALWNYYGLQQDFTSADGRIFFPGDPPMELAQTADIDVFSDTIIFLTNDNVVHTCLIETIRADIRECLVLIPRDSSDTPIDISTFDTVDFFSADYPPAYFLLEGQSQTLYRFSIKMILNRAYRFYAAAGEKLPDNPITAFTISDSQLVILAYENELFIGQLRVQ
jgi:hypothetical protein